MSSDERSRLVRWGALLLGAGALVWLSAALAPAVAIDARVAYALAFVVVASSLLLSAYFVPPLPGRGSRWGVGLSLLTLLWIRSLPLNGLSAALLTVTLLCLTSLLGSAIGARIQQPGHLLAVAAISSLADFWSVYDPTGPSARLAEQAAAEPERLILFALPWAMLGTRHIAAIIGAGDILFAALYLAALAQHGLAVRRAAWAMLVALLVALGLLVLLERPVPLLPFLAAAILLAEPKSRALAPKELRSVALVAGALTLVLLYRLCG